MTSRSAPSIRVVTAGWKTDNSSEGLRRKAVAEVDERASPAELAQTVGRVVAAARDPSAASVFVKRRYFPIMPASVFRSGGGGGDDGAAAFRDAVAVTVLDEPTPDLRRREATVNEQPDMHEKLLQRHPGASIVGDMLVMPDGSELPLPFLLNVLQMEEEQAQQWGGVQPVQLAPGDLIDFNCWNNSLPGNAWQMVCQTCGSPDHSIFECPVHQAGQPQQQFIYCNNCSTFGDHETDQCTQPPPVCTHCGGAHRVHTCPTAPRCSRCFNVDHAVENCPIRDEQTQQVFGDPADAGGWSALPLPAGGGPGEWIQQPMPGGGAGAEGGQQNCEQQ